MVEIYQYKVDNENISIYSRSSNNLKMKGWTWITVKHKFQYTFSPIPKQFLIYSKKRKKLILMLQTIPSKYGSSDLVQVGLQVA